eukprot:COSAG03_NODE_1311_length_4344_cov_180.266667_4_plen_112_part_00
MKPERSGAAGWLSRYESTSTSPSPTHSLIQNSEVRVRQALPLSHSFTHTKLRSPCGEQGVANLFLPLWANGAIADKHVAEAVKHDGVVLGAYLLCSTTFYMYIHMQGMIEV